MPESHLSPHAALIYLMVMVSAADSLMTAEELEKIGRLVRNRPAFWDYDPEKLLATAQAGADMIGKATGLEAAIDTIRSGIPETARATAYALACEVAAADGQLSGEERRMLELVRNGFGLDRLTSAAIERGVTALNSPLPKA